MKNAFESGGHEASPNEHTDCGEEAGQSWVLLLEDDAITGRAIARLMSRASGLFVRLAENGKAAEHLIATFGEPTAIVTDYELGHGDTGVAVLRRLRAARCRAPAAIFSGAPEAALRALGSAELCEVVPVFSKHDHGGLRDWLEQLRLCWAVSA